MKELLKKASLTVASACLIAGGLVSVGWAASNQSEQSASHQHATSSDKKREEAGLPEEITVDGKAYQQVGLLFDPTLQLEPGERPPPGTARGF